MGSLAIPPRVDHNYQSPGNNIAAARYKNTGENAARNPEPPYDP
jgi:hypothetical protein